MKYIIFSNNEIEDFFDEIYNAIENNKISIKFSDSFDIEILNKLTRYMDTELKTIVSPNDIHQLNAVSTSSNILSAINIFDINAYANIIEGTIHALFVHDLITGDNTILTINMNDANVSSITIKLNTFEDFIVTIKSRRNTYSYNVSITQYYSENLDYEYIIFTIANEYSEHVVINDQYTSTSKPKFIYILNTK